MTNRNVKFKNWFPCSSGVKQIYIFFFLKCERAKQSKMDPGFLQD